MGDPASDTPNATQTRALDSASSRSLPPGAPHYRAFVGPPDEYDVMGATQFRLLTALGLREHHTLLDFGCGSLRAGRLLIPYLLPGHYFGLEPNRWLIDDAIARELGTSLINIKRPSFRYDDDFSAAHFGARFDYIVAQSIFSHAGRDVIATSLSGFKTCLNENGLVIATFVLPIQFGNAAEFEGSGWVYPACVTYRLETISTLIEASGLVGRMIPWLHPRQTWFVMAHRHDFLPQPSDDNHLSGARTQIPPDGP